MRFHRRSICIGALTLACLLSLAATTCADDVVEFLSGAKAQGTVTKIDPQNQIVTFEAVIGGRKLVRDYAYSKIHAVQYRGKRYVLNEMAEKDEPIKARNVDELIAEAGRTMPDWYDSTELEFPKSLDLSWPEKPDGGWNNQKNMGQYIWDVINPNPGRWRSGIRLMHHLLEVHKNDAEQRSKVQRELGRMYFELLQDHSRAAYWYLEAGIGKGSRFDNTKNASHLAECYWKLGDRRKALALMDKLPLTYAMLRLWGNMGETRKCVQMSMASLNSAKFPASHYLIIGDAYRVAGDRTKAIEAYSKAVELARKPPVEKQDEKFGDRAEASLNALKVVAAIDLKRTPDGAYRAASIGYEGPVEVEVSVEAGKVKEVRVVNHKEKQFYSSIEDTTAKIVKKQSVEGIDATSGATITSEAIINASAKALAGATQ